MSDEEIVRRVQAGDRELFAELHRRHYDRVWRFARRSLLNVHAAEDVACDTFLRAFASIDRFHVRRDGGFLSFLFRIATNLMADRSRRLAHSGSASLDDFEEWESHLPDDRPEPLETLLYQERIARVRECLARLTMSDRQIVLLAYEQGLSAREVAQVMDKPSVTAVTSHLHRALSKLRAMLLTDNLDPEGGGPRVEDPSATNSR